MYHCSRYLGFCLRLQYRLIITSLQVFIALSSTSWSQAYTERAYATAGLRHQILYTLLFTSISLFFPFQCTHRFISFPFRYPLSLPSSDPLIERLVSKQSSDAGMLTSFDCFCTCVLTTEP